MSQLCHEIVLHNDKTSAPTVREGQGAFHIIVLVMCLIVLSGSLILTPEANGLSLFGYRWQELRCDAYEDYLARDAQSSRRVPW